MRNWILGGFLACFTSAGIAYVLAKNTAESHCGPCIDSSNTLKDRIPADFQVMGDVPSECCQRCERKADGTPKVVDVVDLDRTFLMADGTKPKVSFEEPPLAKPRGEVTPVAFFTPATTEVAPMPQKVEIVSPQSRPASSLPEVAPMPREVGAEKLMFRKIRDLLQHLAEVGGSANLTLPLPHYLKHYPNYVAPDPVFPLQRERDSMLDPTGEIRRGGTLPSGLLLQVRESAPQPREVK